MLKWFRRKREPRTLDQLIFDIAEQQRPEDYEEFYALLPSQRFHARVQPEYADLRGKSFLLFYTAKDHPDLGPLSVEIRGDEALRTTLRSPADGAVFQNAQDSWIALDSAKIRFVAQRAGIEESVVVPPDHKVITYSASPEPSLFRSESGYWILQCGDGRDPRWAIESVERFAATADGVNVIWIIDVRFLQSIESADFARRAAVVAERSRPRMGHTAVFSRECDPEVMGALQDAGFGVHLTGPDDLCFVEVHRPDGIVAGMPGPRLERS